MELLSVKPELYDRLTINPDQLEEFCQQQHIIELALFGSVLRDDFRPDSDIDILITFTPNVKRSLIDLVDMQYELEELSHRSVDLLTKKSVINSANWIRRNEILNTAKIIYESRSSLLA